MFRNLQLNFIFPFTTSYFPRRFRDAESLLARSRDLEYGIKQFLPFLDHCTRSLAFKAVGFWPYLSNPGHKHGLPYDKKYIPSEVVDISSVREETLRILTEISLS